LQFRLIDEEVVRAARKGMKDGEHSQAGTVKYRLQDPGNSLLGMLDEVERIGMAPAYGVMKGVRFAEVYALVGCDGKLLPSELLSLHALRCIFQIEKAVRFNMLYQSFDARRDRRSHRWVEVADGHVRSWWSISA